MFILTKESGEPSNLGVIGRRFVEVRVLKSWISQNLGTPLGNSAQTSKNRIGKIKTKGNSYMRKSEKICSRKMNKVKWAAEIINEN